MGQTWSVPAIAYVGRSTTRADDPTISNPNGKATATSRKPKGADFVMYVGSGYGGTGEGTSFYSIDPLTGDIITQRRRRRRRRGDLPGAEAHRHAVLRRARRQPGGLQRLALPLRSGRRRFAERRGRPRPSRVHRRPLGPPVEVPGGRAGRPAAGRGPGRRPARGDRERAARAAAERPANVTPYVYTTSGNDNRASTPSGQFKNFGFRDDGSDTVGDGVAGGHAERHQRLPAAAAGLFVIPFQDQFRGTVQPSTAYSDTTAGAGRVFFGGTRFNAPNGTYAPPVPPFPCRSSFDSILYALGAQSGLAAYDLAYGNAYQIFQDSRIVAISTQASPKASVLAKDEGLSKTGSPVTPPPPMGLSPSQQATQNIIQSPPAAGVVQPTVRFGSTVCQ